MRWQIGDTGSFSTYVLAINVLDISNQAGKYFGKQVTNILSRYDKNNNHQG